MKTSEFLKSAAIIVVILLVFGLAAFGLNFHTAPLIEANKAGAANDRLNSVMPEGIEIVAVEEPKNKPNEIAAAEYNIEVGFLTEGEAEGFAAGATSVIDGGVLNAEKRSKRGIKTVNLCEMVRSFECVSQGTNVKIKTVLAAGNSVNLNAELLMSALFAEFAAEPEKFSVIRTKLLCEDLSVFE
jgi:radical SAM-linked protein